MTKAFSLALSFINKNEGRIALKMLQSVIGAVDFVSCVDTQSTDDSVSTIKTFLEVKNIPHNLQVAEFQNFSQVRNISLSRIPPHIDWVIVLDCDETIPASDFSRIISFLNCNHDTYDSIYIPRLNFLPDGNIAHYPDRQGRLFKNNRGIKFFGEVHEEIRGYQNVFMAPALQDEDNYFHIYHHKFLIKSQSEIEITRVLYEKLSKNP